MGGRESSSLMFYKKKLHFAAILLRSGSDDKIKWFKWDLKWQLQSSIYLFSEQLSFYGCEKQFSCNFEHNLPGSEEEP